MNEECVFCKIVRKEIDADIIYEDKEHLAFLDIRPATPGQALVITKEHFGSYAFDIPDEVYSKLFLTAKKVAKIIDKALNTKRTFLIMEGIEINHVHLKLYPTYKMQGLLTTLMSSSSSNKEELRKIAEKIRKGY